MRIQKKYWFFFTTVSIILFAIASSIFADFKEDYNQVYQNYTSAGTPEQIRVAAQEFINLADRDDAGALKANSYYWAGECFYKVKDYIKALTNFEKVLAIPKSNKEEHARFKVAMCYIRLDRKEAAKWELNRFIRDYPSSSLIHLVKRALKKLQT
ncbi:MAG: tetratricopeptide repeat protein [Candidatus Hatepunaea meridiana]|nr:tetratricopeptide repeat protein [Candidatus Hatepunaea meridiana]